MPIKLKNYKKRLIDKTIDLYLKTFKAIQIVGPKWCGKTWTSMHHGNSIVRLTDIEKRKLAILSPKLILNENIPEVIDEMVFSCFRTSIVSRTIKWCSRCAQYG